jgi:hypothetical protein
MVRRQEGFSSIRRLITIHEETRMNEEEVKYQRAKKRVEALRGFYVHLGVYVLVNLFLFLLNIIAWEGILWFHIPLLGWSIGLVVHAFYVFGADRVLGADWEEKKIREIMEKENKE